MNAKKINIERRIKILNKNFNLPLVWLIWYEKVMALSRFTMHRSIFKKKIKLYLSCAPSLYAHAHSIHLLNGGWIINKK
jgi:hypothetical protein